MLRTLIAAATLGLLVAVPAGAARGRTEVRSVDTGAYPVIRVTATASPDAVTPTVLENGKAVDGLTAENLGDNKAVVLAVDRSRSMLGRPIVHASAAAAQFVGSKPPSDRVMLVAFGSEALALTRFSSATIDADTALRTIAVDDRPGTALYDAVVLASTELRRQELSGRVLILMTDGRNSGGSASLPEAIRAARQAGVVAYPIAITTDQTVLTPLRRLAARTGGRLYSASSSASLTAIYGQVERELRRLWRLEYATAARPGEPLTVSVRVPGEGTATAKAVAPGARAPVRSEEQALPSAVVDERWGGLGIALAAGLLLLVALRISIRKQGGEELRKRLAPHVGDEVESSRERAAFRPRARLEGLFAATERNLGGLRQWKALQRLLERAAVPLRPAELLYLGLGVGFVLAFLTAVTLASTPAIVAALIIGASVPLLVVAVRARKRMRKFDEQLPDLLAAVASSLRAGHSLKQGLHGVVSETAPPAGVEFSRVLAEARLGRPLDEALDAMCERIGSADLHYVATAVSVQQQVGGSMSGLFDMVSDTVRQRQQFARKIKSLTAMGRASAYVLVALPFVMATLITLINPGYMTPLVTTGAGKFMIGLGLTGIAFGSLLLKKIVTIKG